MKRLLWLILCLFPAIAISQQWHKLGPGVAYPTVSASSLKVINGDLYVGGGFGTRFGAQGNGIAKYNSITQKWDSVGTGVDNGEVSSIELFNGEIYIGGDFQGVMPGPPYSPYTKDFVKWNGSQWLPVDTASPILNSPVRALKFRNELYVGGDIYTGNFHFIAGFNGTTWNDMQGGVDGFPGSVFAMTVYKNKLIVGGDFQNAANNTIQTNFIATWDGSKWDSLGSGLNNSIRSLTVDTVNDVLYAGGGFTMAGGVPVHFVAKWDGTKWLDVPDLPTVCGPRALKVFNGKLYAGVCNVTYPNFDPVLFVLDSAGWKPVYGPDQSVFAMEIYNGNLYVAGLFNKIDTTTVNCIACYGDSCPGTLIPLTLPYSVNESKGQSLKFKVFPNPTKGELNIFMEEKENKEYILKIYNAIGNRILERKISKQTNVNTSGFSKGIYQVQVCDEDGKFCHTEKVIIQ
jgi:hypothetical protein